MLLQGFFEIVIDDRQGIPEDLIHEIQAGADLVGDSGRDGAGTFGQPEGRNLGMQGHLDLVAFALGGFTQADPLQQGGDAVELGKNGTPAGLGGVGGQNHFDGQVFQQGGHLGSASYHALSGWQRRRQSIR